MATTHISVSDAALDFAGVMEKVRAGEDFIIDEDGKALATLQSTGQRQPGRTAAEMLASLAGQPEVIMDEDFSRDLQAVIDMHREPLDMSAWD